jgi:hypothetical protein
MLLMLTMFGNQRGTMQGNQDVTSQGTGMP